jgi:hypothetical protein
MECAFISNQSFCLIFFFLKSYSYQFLPFSGKSNKDSDITSTKKPTLVAKESHWFKSDELY